MTELVDRSARFKFIRSAFKTADEREQDIAFTTISDAEHVYTTTNVRDIPSKMFGQIVRYRFSIGDYNFYTDGYRDIVIILTPEQVVTEDFDLEDLRDIGLAASDYKCKLTRFDIEESSDKESLIRYIKSIYESLKRRYGDSLKIWRLTEDGVRVKLTDGTIIELEEEEIDSINESNELEDRARKHRRKQDGLSPFCSLGESLEIYNGTDIPDFDYTQINLADSKEIGLHCGTEQACKDKGYKYINKLTVSNENILALDTDMSGYWSDLSVLKYLESIFSEDEIAELRTQMRSFAGEESDIKYKNYSTILRNAILNKGYNVISYPNNVEDIGSTSYIILDSSIIDKPVVESRKKKKPYDSINTDAGNVEHNINMFNHMNNPAESPSTNPTGPMAEALTTGPQKCFHISLTVNPELKWDRIYTVKEGGAKTLTVRYRKRSNDFVITETNPKYIFDDATLRFISESDAQQFIDKYVKLSTGETAKIKKSQPRELVQIDCPDFPEVPLYTSLTYVSRNAPSVLNSTESSDSDPMAESYRGDELAEFFDWVQSYSDGALWDDFVAEFESVDDYELNIDDILEWLKQFNEDAYYDFINLDDEDQEDNLDESRDPYFKPYGYRDAAKVINGTAPAYYYHLKEIEMETGDGLKLAKYAKKKGHDVRIEQPSDPDYPTYYIPGKYHWGDYFYPYPAYQENADDPKFGEELTESSNNEEVTLYYSDMEVEVFYGSMSWEDGTYPSYTDHIDWEYDVDRYDIECFLIESCITDKIVDGWDDMTDEQANTYVSEHFDELFTKFENEILDHWYESALENAQENYDPDDYIDWDSMPGGHDDID